MYRRWWRLSDRCRCYHHLPALTNLPTGAAEGGEEEDALAAITLAELLPCLCVAVVATTAAKDDHIKACDHCQHGNLPALALAARAGNSPAIAIPALAHCQQGKPPAVALAGRAGNLPTVALSSAVICLPSPLLRTPATCLPLPSMRFLIASAVNCPPLPSPRALNMLGTHAATTLLPLCKGGGNMLANNCMSDCWQEINGGFPVLVTFSHSLTPRGQTLFQFHQCYHTTPRMHYTVALRKKYCFPC